MTVAWLKRAALVLLASILAWRIVSLGMAEFYANRAGGDPAAALAWYLGHPSALRGLAARLEGSDPARAEALLARAYLGDPADGRTLLRLAVLWRRQGQAERADKACELAEQLLPADAALRLLAAQYWLAGGSPQRALRDWDLAMQINPALAPPLFPALLELAKSKAGLSLLAPVAARLPPWWPSFFAYATQNAAQVDTLRALYTLRKAASQPSAPTEFNAYLMRLMREGLWAEAYMVWINALAPEQQQVLGYLYDGGFELTAFQGGFDWSATTAGSAQATAHYTQAVTGKKALHAVLRGRVMPSSLVEQTVFLLPGHYRFSGRARPDALQAGAGLEWALECAATGARLAASERFLGSDIWRRFAVDFHVAGEGCAGVKLRLGPVGYAAGEQEAKGEIWFDDLAIELAEGVAGESPAMPSQNDQASSAPRPGNASAAPGVPRRAAKAAPWAKPPQGSPPNPR